MVGPISEGKDRVADKVHSPGGGGGGGGGGGILDDRA